MVIRSSQPDPSRRIPTPGAEAAATQPAAPRESGLPEQAPLTSKPHDRADVSSAAQELFESAASAPVQGSLSPEKLRGVLERIREGHYDRPEVLDQVARKLGAEVQGPGSKE